jgi:lipopolysaccharide export system protein LptA
MGSNIMMFRVILFALALSTGPTFLSAQNTEVPFTGAAYDPKAPVEVTSDSLRIDNSDGSAVFDGDVNVVQGQLHITAQLVRVEYETGEAETRDVSKILASGNVTFVNGKEAAEADRAEYDVAAKKIIMSGDVIVTQGVTAISGDKMTVNLETGKGVISGRVKTVLKPSE